MMPPLMKKPRGKDAPAKPIKHAGTQRVHAERKAARHDVEVG